MPDLYALPPEEFTAARDAQVEQARADGDRARAKELAALRRPTVPAHLVNLLVRGEPDLVTSLLELGGQLAEAQRAGSGDALRALGEQRRALVQAVTARAVDLGGRDVAAAVRGEVEATLEAALADPAAAEAVRTGRLVRALSFAGFGGADLAGAIAPATAPTPAPATAPAPARERTTAADDARREAERTAALQAAERAALDAAGALDDAVRACERAQQQAQAAGTRRDEADDAVRAAERALVDAREAREQADGDVRQADGQAERAVGVVHDRQEAAESARADLDRLRRG